jgi:hypothetical protein
MRWDREDELDLADVGGEANATAHGEKTPAGHTEGAGAILIGTNKELYMPGNPREMITVAERRFPVRIRIAVPSGGFGQRYAQITAWLDENCGADGWAMTPSGVRGVLNDAVSIYFADTTLASAFVARWCAGYKVETGDGVFRVRDDEPVARNEASLHRTP